LGVPYPKTIYPRDFDEVKEISRNIKYPVVIKPISARAEAKATGKPVTIEKEETLPDATTRIQYTLLED
jgi:carbamoylphosphate synthase large subunit